MRSLVLTTWRKKMGQKGFWDEQERREKLNQKKPMLQWLNENINWEDFRPILETIYSNPT